MFAVKLPLSRGKLVPLARHQPRRRAAAFTLPYRPVLYVACAAFGLQLIAMIAFALYQLDRFALTWDFQIYYQAWYLMATGVRNPFISDPPGHFYPNLYEMVYGVLPLLGAISKSPAVITISQACFAVAAEVAGFLWIADIVDDRMPATLRVKRLVIVAGIALAILNPWTYWACAFDYHNYVMGGAFLTAAVWRFYRGAWVSAFVWTILTLLTGMVLATFVAALGVGVALASRRTRIAGAGVVALAIAYLMVVREISMHLGAGTGGVVSALYAYLGTHSEQYGTLGIALDILLHPGLVLQTLWNNRVDAYANVAPGGFLALLCPWTAFPWILALLENLLASGAVSGFGTPSFQYAEVYPLAAPGFIWTLTWLYRRVHAWFTGRRLTVVLAVAVVNAAFWGFTWIPQASLNYVRVRPEVGRALGEVKRTTPPGDEVIASQGNSGPFGDRQWVYSFFGDQNLPLRTPRTRIVLVPYDGIQVASSEATTVAIQQMLADPHARLIHSSDDVWAFDYRRGGKQKGVRLGSDIQQYDIPAMHGELRFGQKDAGEVLDAALFPSDRFYHRHIARLGQGYLEADGRQAKPGYLLRKAYWRRPAGTYRIAIDGRSSAPITYEIVDGTTNYIFVREQVKFRERSTTSVDFEFRPDLSKTEDVYVGWGPFRIEPYNSYVNHRIELRLVVPPHVRARVYDVALIRSL